VEGVNLGGILLFVFVAPIVFGVVSLVAVGFLIAQKIKVARIVFASGFLCATLIAAFATLTFLDRQFHHGSSEGVFIVGAALFFLLVGSGQFIAAIRNQGTYAAAFACAAGSLVYGMLASLRGDAFMSMRLPQGPAISLLLAAASLVIAVLPTRRKTSPLLWTALALFGGIAGCAVGSFFVTTHCQPLEPPGGQALTQVRVKVYLLGMPVSEETGLAAIDGSPVRFLSFAQGAWVYGTQIFGAAAGLFAALAIAARLVGQATETLPAGPGISEDFPPIHGYSSEHIKRM
jgi:hypothetical protein